MGDGEGKPDRTREKQHGKNVKGRLGRRISLEGIVDRSFPVLFLQSKNLYTPNRSVNQEALLVAFPHCLSLSSEQSPRRRLPHFACRPTAMLALCSVSYVLSSCLDSPQQSPDAVFGSNSLNYSLSGLIDDLFVLQLIRREESESISLIFVKISVKECCFYCTGSLASKDICHNLDQRFDTKA